MKYLIAFIFGVVLAQIIVFVVIHRNDTAPIVSQTECKADSLQAVIYDLQGEQEMENKVRNEEVENLKNLIAKYEFGIGGLDKHNRKEFIRYAMFSDAYSEQLNEDYFEENRKIKQKAGYASIK
jgi:hypothetical protein